VVLTVKVSFILAENSFTAVKAQLNKAASDHKFLFVAAIDVSLSLSCWFAIKMNTGQLLALCKKKKEHYKHIELQLMACY